MSRIGRMPVKLQEGVEVKIVGDNVNVSGQLGKLVLSKPSYIELTFNNYFIIVKCSGTSEIERAMFGTFRQMVNNAIIGVKEGFTKKMKLFGIGYELEDKGECIRFKLGYSHDILWSKKDYISYSVLDKITLKISGIDKEKARNNGEKV